MLVKHEDRNNNIDIFIIWACGKPMDIVYYLIIKNNEMFIDENFIIMVLIWILNQIWLIITNWVKINVQKSKITSIKL